MAEPRDELIVGTEIQHRRNLCREMGGKNPLACGTALPYQTKQNACAPVRGKYKNLKKAKFTCC
jgi:hypothetical protein